ncbi:hypothetical protein R1flu_011554 [Riccia fluitans]|uniref:Uncharacterized protein n=1 Tax=Riccia fluitans TaxID=41844 RepID=A0ABD1ZCC7_9MARC
MNRHVSREFPTHNTVENVSSLSDTESEDYKLLSGSPCILSSLEARAVNVLHLQRLHTVFLLSRRIGAAGPRKSSIKGLLIAGKGWRG